ncbi:MAG: PTS sugar transporter subunit IIA, partial [Candidatus Eisenbacteria bacterium]|nr:PTS sugar transporter subunit IIA [Candidatus Eisenbacteria bacterium]
GGQERTMLNTITEPTWVIDVAAATRDMILERLVALIAPRLGDLPSGRVLQAVLQRERQCPTVVSDNLAVPHARLAGLAGFYVGLARVSEGVEFAPGQRVRMVCLLLGPDGNQKQYLDVLAALLRVFQEKEGKLLRAKSLPHCRWCAATEGRQKRVTRWAGRVMHES